MSNRTATTLKELLSRRHGLKSWSLASPDRRSSTRACTVCGQSASVGNLAWTQLANLRQSNNTVLTFEIETDTRIIHVAANAWSAFQCYTSHRWLNGATSPFRSTSLDRNESSTSLAPSISLLTSHSLSLSPFHSHPPRLPFPFPILR